jgi:cysteine desulfurase / selenocysteine lyase
VKSLAHFKSQFNSNSKKVHLNNAGLAPISLPARDAIEYWAKKFYEDGFYTDHEYMTAVAETRINIGHLVGCESSEIAFFPSTAWAINQVAKNVQLNSGDEVLLWDQEYSSHFYPWQQACSESGARLRVISSEIDLSTPTEKFISAINSSTKVVAFSWVQFQSGAMMDIEAVVKAAKQVGAFVIVDVMQGLGIIPQKIWHYGIDAIAGGSHKWLTSPVGVGFLALRNEWHKPFKPLAVGSATYGTCDDPSSLVCIAKPDATKFEPGSKQVLEILALNASIKNYLEHDQNEVHSEALRLSHKLAEGLNAMNCKVINSNAKLSGSNDRLQVPFVNWTPPGGSKLDVNTVLPEFIQRGINGARRGPGIRFSPHAFNSDHDIEIALNIISELL